MKKTETRRASVDLSGFHDGQAIRHEVTMEADGRYYPAGRNAFRKRAYNWLPFRWRAVHTMRLPDGTHETVIGAWEATQQDAESWLEQERGLRLGGSYWHTARAVESIR